jgi:hypothetical protein
VKCSRFQAAGSLERIPAASIPKKLTNL